MAEQFADLSHHNATVDLAAYAKAGHARVALKATDGRAFNDPAFPARWKAAGRARLSRVAYHYAQTETSGAQEADHILAILAKVGGLGEGDVLALDVEDNDSATARRRADEFAGEFCRRMVDRGHPTGLLYTGRWYADPAGITPADVPAGWARLWLSDYGTAADATMRLPAGWTRSQVVARQFTNAATVAGIGGTCDYNRVLADWLHPADQQDRHDQEDDMVIVTAPGRGWMAYYPASGAVRLIAPGEQGPLEAVHKAAGSPAVRTTLSDADWDLLAAHVGRGLVGQIPGVPQLAGLVAGRFDGLTAAVVSLSGLSGADGVDGEALAATVSAAAQEGTAAALHEAAQAVVDQQEPAS